MFLHLYFICYFHEIKYLFISKKSKRSPMSSSDDDWFDQDENKLLQGLEKSLKSLELQKNEEYIECPPSERKCPPSEGKYHLMVKQP